MNTRIHIFIAQDWGNLIFPNHRYKLGKRKEKGNRP